ncbi:hypothetical protein [Streptomyces sp. NBC_01233]|uniref:hypothetical protein n=1 Tax=Streptomyces sp. NBC_01233 TaxID=2903787 RepID=UPI002E15FD12|nr:hypothetical protein OG332_22965 [Streptomyces sp. NBC_01233]
MCPNRPVGPFFREVRALRDHAFELLKRRQPPQYIPDLYAGAGALRGVLANAGFDLGRHGAVETRAAPLSSSMSRPATAASGPGSGGSGC